MVAIGPAGLSEEQIAARIERLPLSAWYLRVMAIVGTAHFFDAFDSLTIAFVLPVLAGTWHIAPGAIGFLISSGYVWQLLGAVGLGWAAERLGRLSILRWTLALIALASIACAFAGDFRTLVALRFVQGLGLGAEVPVAATYLNELSKAAYRGRLIIFLQSCFAIGIAITSFLAIWIIPHLGWQAMFVLGALPALIALWARRLVPESPRWLAGRGRLAEADAAMVRIEAQASRHSTRPLPPLPAGIPPVRHERAGWASLFRGIYLRRTLSAWALTFCTSFVGYGLLTWVPTLFRTVYHLSMTATLHDSFVFSALGVLGALACLVLIDWIGRRACFLISFLGGAAPLLALWALGAAVTADELMWLGSVSLVFMGFLLTGVYVYIPEIYPTRMRALGIGVASSWLRIASIVGPTIVGLILGRAGIGPVFLMFGAVGLVGALVVALFVIETRGRILEDIAP